MMGFQVGIEQGMAQVTLALFTTLAPAGAGAFIVMALFLLFGKLDDAVRVRMQRLIIVPVVVGMVGFISSATHLGKPSNALYVLTGFLRSPLSDEVFASAAFYGVAWVYWYAGFSERNVDRLKNALLVLGCIGGVIQIAAISSAYSIETIATWNSVYVPVNLVLAVFQGFPLLAVAMFAFLDIPNKRKVCLVLLSVAALATVLAVVAQAMQSAELAATLSNYEYGAASNLVPWYGAAMIIEGVFAAAAIAVDAFVLFCYGETKRVLAIAACVLMFVGIFAVRFAFYCMHLTVGL